MITKKDISTFTEGWCHRLALAINRETGWPVVAFWNAFMESYDTHAFVRTPRGTFLDIKGEHTADEMCREWYESEIREVDDLEFFDRDGEWGGFLEQSYADKRASKLVPEVLQLVEAV